MKRRKLHKRKAFKYVDKLAFKEIRRRNSLTICDASELLSVSESTIRAWESGVHKIPYSAFKLLRVMASGEVFSEDWEGWQFRGDTLYSPAGRGFKAYELLYLSNYMQMARLWIKDRQRVSNGRNVIRMKPKLRIVTDPGQKHAG